VKKNWWRGLRTKIIAWSFVPTAIILSAVAWFTFYSYQRVIGDLAIKQDWAVVQSKTGPLFEAFVGVANPTLIRALLQVDVRKEDPLEIRAQAILDQTQGIDIFDGGIYFVDQQGKVVKTWPEQRDLLGQDWSDTPHLGFVIDHPGRAADTSRAAGRKSFARP
jgi:hypothetical protein